METDYGYCHYCEHELSYSKEHDAKYCRICDIWVEIECGDPDCNFCIGRPEKPSDYYDK